MSNRMISPSEVLAQAIGLEPEGVEANHSGMCVTCGAPYGEKDIVIRANFPDSFTNWAALGNPSGTHQCGWCAAVAPHIQKLQCLIASRDGVSRLLSNNEIADLINNPPTPPFVAHIGMVGKSSHVTWRTPVSLSRDVFFVRDGEQVIQINRSKVLTAVRDNDRLRTLYSAYLNERYEAAKAGRKKGDKIAKPPREFLKGSVLRLVSGFGHAESGMVRGEYLKFAEEKKLEGDLAPAEIIGSLMSLSPGDAWGLQKMIYAESAGKGSRITIADLKIL